MPHLIKSTGGHLGKSVYNQGHLANTCGMVTPCSVLFWASHWSKKTPSGAYCENRCCDCTGFYQELPIPTKDEFDITVSFELFMFKINCLDDWLVFTYDTPYKLTFYFNGVEFWTTGYLWFTGPGALPLTRYTITVPEGTETFGIQFELGAFYCAFFSDHYEWNIYAQCHWLESVINDMLALMSSPSGGIGPFYRRYHVVPLYPHPEFDHVCATPTCPRGSYSSARAYVGVRFRFTPISGNPQLTVTRVYTTVPGLTYDDMRPDNPIIYTSTASDSFVATPGVDMITYVDGIKHLYLDFEVTCDSPDCEWDLQMLPAFY